VESTGGAAGAPPREKESGVHARSITIMADPQKIDSGIEFVRDEVQPMIMSMDGCIGLSMLVDRATGHCIVTSAWRDEESMKASNALLLDVRARGGELMGGEPRVEEWEVGVMHRDHEAPEGSCCRVTWLQLEHGDVERALDAYRTHVLPRVEAMDGFCSASMLIDRMTGRACGTVAFESKAACAASRDQAAAVRSAGAGAAGATVTDVVEFELAIAHLRLPELV
jgi:quinol monooxygenase YgiN